MVQPKTKKETYQPAREKMAFLPKTTRKPNKLNPPQDLTIDEVIRQVINHHIGIMM